MFPLFLADILLISHRFWVWGGMLVGLLEGIGKMALGRCRAMVL